MLTLPIRSNRISWKLLAFFCSGDVPCWPYLLGQIGLVGNHICRSLGSARVPSNNPYLLGQIGLVGNNRYR